MKKVITILLVVAFLIGFVGCSSSSTNNSSDSTSVNLEFELVGNYSEKVQNGIKRVQSVYVKNFKDSPQAWSDLQSYARKLIWVLGDSNTVLFFNDRSMTPDVTTTGELFDEKYDDYCIAGYWKDADGKEQFIHYPYKE
jgi:hypothetical protein